jgi:hypothetical protein
LPFLILLLGLIPAGRAQQVQAELSQEYRGSVSLAAQYPVTEREAQVQR